MVYLLKYCLKKKIEKEEENSKNRDYTKLYIVLNTWDFIGGFLGFGFSVCRGVF